MRTIRIVPRLDIKGPNLVKGIHLEWLRALGDPAVFAKYYYESGADEILLMEVVASLYPVTGNWTGRLSSSLLLVVTLLCMCVWWMAHHWLVGQLKIACTSWFCLYKLIILFDECYFVMCFAQFGGESLTSIWYMIIQQLWCTKLVAPKSVLKYLGCLSFLLVCFYSSLLL